MLYYTAGRFLEPHIDAGRHFVGQEASIISNLGFLHSLCRSSSHSVAFVRSQINHTFSQSPAIGLTQWPAIFRLWFSLNHFHFCTQQRYFHLGTPPRDVHIR